LIVEAHRRGIPLSNDSQIFLENAPCRVIGITGSAGKTTTTSLVGRMAEMAEGYTPEQSQPDPLIRRVWVGGNIGAPLISSLDEMSSDDLAVMELSSFQLELMTRSPQVAAVLNITPNHLDRHASMQAYTAAKARILDFQDSQAVAVLGQEDPGSWGLADRVHGELLSFGRKRPAEGQRGACVEGERLFYWDGSLAEEIVPRSCIRLRGEHNLLNVLAACAIGAGTGLPIQAMRAGIAGFSGMPHRLELVRIWRGAEWYNDSIATAPERAMAAIRSFDKPIVLLAGGRDKLLPWDEFAQLVHQRVDHLVLFGEAADKISRVIGVPAAGSRPYTLRRCSNLKEAIQVAADVVEPGDVVLLAPGGTSFDEFRDFEERGEVFRKWVSELS
jgi:UDP-N-acetylmuramoylalanine--D-glutamate ligase